MDREHVKGAADKVKGSVKDATGKLIDDKELQAEGKIDKAKGAVHTAHKAKGAVHTALGDIKDCTHGTGRHQG